MRKGCNKIIGVLLILVMLFNCGVGLNDNVVKAESTSYLTGTTQELSYSQTPYGIHGKLTLQGTNIVDKNGEKCQLRGASLHGLQWDVGYNYINEGSFKSLRDDWGINLIRLPIYVTQGGYTEGAGTKMDARIQDAVRIATDLGMYVIIDWHIHETGTGTVNPNRWTTQAQAFFDKYSKMYANYDNILYEICNEPINTKWYDGSGNDLYSYANKVIPKIRQNDPDAIVIVGTNTWSQDVDEVSKKPLSYSDVVYTIHFYSATHTQYLRDKVQKAINAGTPIFCSEFGVCSADGNGSYNLDEANKWMQLFDKNNISYVCWHLSNKGEKSAYLKTSVRSTTGGWTNSDLTDTGAWLVNVNRPKADAEKIKYNIPVKISEQWMKDSIGWWYRYSDGSYPSNCWKYIGNAWYAFDRNGYMRTGWFKDNAWYYLEKSGAMVTGWKKINNVWYYFNGSGAMQTGWKYIGNSWYYMDSSGAMKTGWIKLNNTWYYLNNSGAMVTGWKRISNVWYYFDGNGAMQTGWKLLNGKWYYLYSNGAMAHDCWIDGYYLKSNGSMR